MSSVPHKKLLAHTKGCQLSEKMRYQKGLRLKEILSDEERFILKQAVRLDDGTMGEVVSVRKNRKGILIYECHLCKCYGQDMAFGFFLEHFYGNKHARNLKQPVHSRNRFFLRYPNDKLKRNLDVGPLTPCQIQNSLDSCIKPLIGLEYLLEIDTLEPKYKKKILFHCLLCNKKCDNIPGTICHLVSTGHYLKYFYMFFHKVVSSLQSNVRINVSKEDFKKIVEDVAEKIEKYYGRLKPRRVTSDEIKTSLFDILDVIDKGPHFWETPTQIFFDCTDMNLVYLAPEKRFSGLDSLHPLPPPVTEITPITAVPPTPKPTPVPMSKLPLRPASDQETTVKSGFRFVNKNEDCSNSNVVHNTNTPTNSQRSGNRFNEDKKRSSEYTQSGHETQLLWQKYKEKIQEIETDLLEEMIYYKKNPDKHPKYEMEYKKYYIERAGYLLRHNEDPKEYDIRCEFTTFWDKLLEEMYENIFQKQKLDVQHQFKLNNSNHMGDFVRNTKSRTELDNQNSLTAIKRNYESQIDQNNLQFLDSSNKRIKQHSNVQLILVLRHLSILEHYLGSLGPKVDNLLSQTLLLEKMSSSNSVLTDNNCVMLETVKEKLLGFLQTGILPQSMISTTETAIRNINNLLASVLEKKEQMCLDKIHSVSEEGSYNRRIFYSGNQ